MLTEQQLDQFIDEFWEDTPNEAQEEEAAEDLEEYTLPSDGMIIRQMEKKGKVNRRTWFALALMLLVVPLLLYLSVRFFHGRKYLICSLIVIVAAMLPFFMMFEGRKPKAREIMVISVLAAIGVAGRAAFFMVPSFKPVAAIVILTGVSFGGEAGFLVGCLIMMLSNMFMGQGPWTPWQMFSFGIIGFPCRDPLSERNLKSKETGPLHLWIFKCGPDLRRDHEPGKHPDVLWVYHTGQPGCFLYFRNPGGPGACTVNRDLFMVFEQACFLKNWNALRKNTG